MKRYGNIRITRRMVAIVCMLVVAVNILMPKQIVFADVVSGSSYVSYKYQYPYQDKWYSDSHNYTFSYSGTSPVYSYICEYVRSSDGFIGLEYGFCSKNRLDSYELSPSHFIDVYNKYGAYFYVINHAYSSPESLKLGGTVSDIFCINPSSDDDGASLLEKVGKYVSTGEKSDGMIIGGSGYMPNTQAYSEIGCLDNVQMETYVTNKKELIDADENADLSKINQDKVIVYSSSTTSGIDLSKGGYKVQLYGSYAWQDKSGNIKSEDKGHKTFIKDWDAQDNIKGLYRSRYHWIDWKSANDKVEVDKTDKAHKPNVFEKMTTYANYQYEPIWYLRIVSQDNKYGAWVKLYNSTNKGKYRSESVDDDDNAVPDSGGGYNKPKDTSEITGTGDTPEDAKNNVPKAEEKQDNDDLNDSANGNNSTFDKLEQFTKGIGDVPKMIADIFSFLPSWCLEVVAIGFALLMILIVVKFIRG